MPHLREIGDFLRTHRGSLDPDDFNIVSSGTRRRVSGLRREEVAQMAAISADYYTRIEQGRLVPSGPVLESLIEVLRLSDDQAEYVLSLLDHAAQAQAVPKVVASRERRPRLKIRPQLQSLLDQLTESPAYVLGPRMEILAWNRLAELVYLPFREMPKDDLNFVLLVFTNDKMKNLFEDWTSVARSCVAILRREATSNPDDPELAKIVGELSIANREFGKWWAARNVARQDFGTKTLQHPEAGELELDWDMFRYSSAPEQQLVVNVPKDGSFTAQRLKALMEAHAEGIQA